MQGKDDGLRLSRDSSGTSYPQNGKLALVSFLDTVHLLRLLRKVSTIFRR
jgi:hypothetical protein